MFPVAAYFGPDAGEQKGQNPAVSKAMEGEANVAEGIPRLFDEEQAKKDLISLRGALRCLSILDTIDSSTKPYSRR